MKIVIKESVKHGKPVLKCVAKIIKSRKIQIPRTIQRTWSTPFDPERSQYTREQVSVMFIKAAKTWQLKKMKEIFGDQLPSEVQAELV